MNHTPGPWTFRGCEGGWAIDFNDDQEQVVDFVYEYADARLIAASPDLLSSTERLLHNFKLLLAGKPVRDAAETIAEAESAITKATA